MKHAIGWAASILLLLTISSQIYRQWKSGTSKGVSKWLFIGQMAASAGFTWYSYLVHDLIFILTNALMLLSAMLGLGIVIHHRRHEDKG
jgi:MtN3 and saliva related transmembrane protein